MDTKKEKDTLHTEKEITSKTSIYLPEQTALQRTAAATQMATHIVKKGLSNTRVLNRDSRKF